MGAVEATSCQSKGGGCLDNCSQHWGPSGTSSPLTLTPKSGRTCAERQVSKEPKSPSERKFWDKGLLRARRRLWQKIRSLLLRHFALVHGAHLVLTSLKEKTSMNAMRSVLRQMLFGVAPKGGLPEQLDHSKPICVAAGKDSVAGIGLPASGQASDRAWREYVQHLFPDPSPSHKGKRTDADQVQEELYKYPESSIDGMVEQRVEELQQYRRQVERNQRLASEGIEGNKVLTVAA
ncbi:unnamed protein product [Effrenium voratum]|nr:unnamed protein product [Effrenium voratum]